MKAEFLPILRDFKQRLSGLRRAVAALTTPSVAKIAIRKDASDLADLWIETIRSPLEHRFKLDPKVIAETAEHMKRLHVLSRPNNKKASYVECLTAVLSRFDDKFILPVQQSFAEPGSVMQLAQLIPTLKDADQTDYLTEAIECAQAGHSKAAIVMGWCAAIDCIQKKVISNGFQTFNAASTAIKNQTSCKYKRWNKEFKISTEAELQKVFDSDLIIVVESLGLLDGNQSERLETCFKYRNQSAHPGLAPIESPHVVAFFTDIVRIVLTNPKFD